MKEIIKDRKKLDYILEESKKYDSFYLYDESVITDSIKNLKDNFKDIEILYSLKTNPNKEVVKVVFNQGLGVDAASLGEVNIAISNGVKPENIFFSAPGKSDASIKDAIGKCTIIADSIGEVERINAISSEIGANIKIGVRINPSFSFDNTASQASKFGIDEEILFDNLDNILNMKNISVVGIHTHLKSQELDIDKIKTYYKNILDLSDRVEDKIKSQLEFINMGSCIGVDYSEEQSPVDLKELGKYTSEIIEEFKKKNKDTRVLIESGRYVVCKSGVYVTKVMDKKQSHGENLVILNNTLNGFIRPSYEQLVKSYAGDNAKMMEPIYTTNGASQIQIITDEKEVERVTIYGNLCSSADIVAKDIELPKLKVGDIVVFSNAGSYAAVLSPMQFSSQIPPEEILYKI